MHPFDIRKPDDAIRPALQQKIDNLTKPKGALGRLEELALQAGLVQQTLSPSLSHPHNLIFAADHGITAEGVSFSPREVTWQQCIHFATSTGGGVNYLCRQHGFTLRIIDHMRETCGLECDVSVVPGVTAVQVLTAAHGITINRIGEAIHITTGRNLHATSEKDRRNCVVMLDGGTAWQDAYTEHTYIWWGAYLGTPQQELRHGYVKDVGDEIAELKASLREEHGWIMDTYLLREVD